MAIKVTPELAPWVAKTKAVLKEARHRTVNQNKPLLEELQIFGESFSLDADILIKRYIEGYWVYELVEIFNYVDRTLRRKHTQAVIRFAMHQKAVSDQGFVSPEQRRV